MNELGEYMPYRIQWEKNGVLVRFWGTFNFKENNNATIAILENHRFENLKYIIWDLSDIFVQDMTRAEASLAAMHDLLIASRLPHVKMALLAKDKRTLRICDQYVIRCSRAIKGWEFRVSDSMANIRTWIVSDCT